MRVPWTAWRSNQSILKEINPDYTFEGLMLKEKEVTEDEMVGWHHQLNGHESEQTPGDNEGQGGLACSIRGVAKS